MPREIRLKEEREVASTGVREINGDEIVVVLKLRA